MEDRDYIVLSDDWHGLPTSTIHLFRRLSERNRIFWINLTNRMPQANFSDAKKVVYVLGKTIKKTRINTRKSDISHNALLPKQKEPYIATPLMFPWFKKPIRHFNQWSILHSYQQMASKFNVCDPVVFAGFPSAVDFVKSIDASVKIYYCCDEFLDYPGFNPKDWEIMEKDLLDVVDGLVVTSRDLERKNRKSLPCQHLPHGVDFEHFAQTTKSKSVSAMEKIPRPIVGFFGLISHWIDLNLVADLSDRYPEVSFVLIGKADIPPTMLVGRKNVFILGHVPYEELPQYARYFDIGLIPFKDSELTRAVNPLKLMEYYALGLPVLATRLPELEKMSGPIHLASDINDFSHRLSVMLAADREIYKKSAMEIARQNSWECRANQLSQFILLLNSL